MKILDYPYGYRLNLNGLKTTIHYAMIGVRTIIGLYFFVDILTKQIWIISNTFFIVFTNWWTFDFEQRKFIIPTFSHFNMVVCWILWLMIISVITALQRNCMEIFSCDQQQQTNFDIGPEPKELEAFLESNEVNFKDSIH